MRTLCDVCESAAAIFFCAADEAALCPSCDDKVHTCNKLANRHVRVRLAEPRAVPRCDICENSPAFFYCEMDGSSLCLQCDMAVHVGGKRTHGRYLLFRQRVEFPTDKPGQFEDPAAESNDQVQSRRRADAYPQNHKNSSGPVVDSSPHDNESADSKMIDLNMKPQRLPDHPPHNQESPEVPSRKMKLQPGQMLLTYLLLIQVAENILFSALYLHSLKCCYAESLENYFF